MVWDVKVDRSHRAFAPRKPRYGERPCVIIAKLHYVKVEVTKLLYCAMFKNAYKEDSKEFRGPGKAMYYIKKTMLATTTETEK